MAINAIVQYNSGFLPKILLLTQAPIVVWFDGCQTLIISYTPEYYYYIIVPSF